MSRIRPAFAALAAAPDPSDEDKVVALLDRVTEVAPARAAARRVIRLTEDPNCDIRRVAETIAADPALAAQTMRLANGSPSRRGQPLDSLGQAVLALGLQQLHGMASALAMMAMFGAEEDVLRFHATSVLAGTLAGMVAGAAGADPGAAYLSGLLSEIGAMACVEVDGARFAAMYADAGSSWEKRAELERERYGAPSWHIGARLLARNGLPEHVCRAVGSSYDDEDGAEHTPLERVTQFGRLAARDILLWPEGESRSLLIPGVVELAWLSGLTDLDVGEVTTLVDRAVASAERKLAGAR